MPIAYDLEEASSVHLDSFDRVQFDRASLVVISSHLIKTLHCPFSSNENQDAAASSFYFDFVTAALAHQYLPGDGSIIGTCIIAPGWVNQFLPVVAVLLVHKALKRLMYNISITHCTVSNNNAAFRLIWQHLQAAEI